jgi:hypothetical protein
MYWFHFQLFIGFIISLIKGLLGRLAKARANAFRDSGGSPRRRYSHPGFSPIGAVAAAR